jgi:hypothetical protein
MACTQHEYQQIVTQVYNHVVTELDRFLAEKGAELWDLARAEYVKHPYLKLPDTHFWAPVAERCTRTSS